MTDEKLPRIASARGRVVMVEMDYDLLADIAGAFEDSIYGMTQGGDGEESVTVRFAREMAAAFYRMGDEFTEGLDANGMS